MILIVIISSICIGVLLHYTFNFFNCNGIVALFSACNESVWEHLKLSYFSINFVGIAEYFILNNDVNNFFLSKLSAVVFAGLFTIVFFYTYSGIIGRNIVIVDILTFCISIIFAEIISYRIMQMNNINLDFFANIINLIICFLFFYFTNNPIKINIFKDPIYNIYGKICLKQNING